MKDAVRTGAIASVGPAFSAAIVVLSVVALLGSGVALFRCGVIGSADYELYIAESIAKALNIDLSSGNFSGTDYALILLMMTLASVVYFINVCVSLKPLDKIQLNEQKASTKEGKKKASFFTEEFSSCMIGTIAIICSWYIYTVGELSSMLVAGIATVIISKIIKRFPKIKALGDWSMAICLVLGMAVGQILTMATL